MHFTLSQAARETGASKSTISKALATGRLSGERLEDGSFRIEASELFRVFPKRTGETGFPKEVVTVREHPGETGERLRAQDEFLQLRVQMLEDQFRREREDRERERELRDRERETILERERTTVEDLRRRLDKAEERVLALTAVPASEKSQERSAEPPALPEPAKTSKGFLGWLRGG